jgi:hypothetical protein
LIAGLLSQALTSGTRRLLTCRLGGISRRRCASRSGWCLRPGCLKGNSRFPSTHKGTTDIPILGTGIERDQPIAMLAVRLKAVPKILRPLSKYHRAFGAFDFDLFIDHGRDLKQPSYHPKRYEFPNTPCPHRSSAGRTVTMRDSHASRPVARRRLVGRFPR